MFTRIANLTWNRPKLVLAVVGALTVFSVVVAHDVEHRLKAAGFTDSASESERATRCSTARLGTTRTRGHLSCATRDHATLDLATPGRAQRGRPPRATGSRALTHFVGKVIDPLTDRRAAGLIARRRALGGDRGPPRDAGRRGATAARRPRTRRSASARGCSRLDGRLRAQLQEVNDQTRARPDEGRDIAFPCLRCCC